MPQYTFAQEIRMKMRNVKFGITTNEENQIVMSQNNTESTSASGGTIIKMANCTVTINILK